MKYLNAKLIISLITMLSIESYANLISPEKARLVPYTTALKKMVDGVQYEKISSVYEYSYKNVMATTKNQTGDSLVLDLDKDAISFAIVIDTKGKYLGYVYDLEDPKRNKIITVKPHGIPEELLSSEDIAGRGQQLSKNAMQPEVFNQISITSVPNSDLVKVIPGKWIFSIAVEETKKIKDLFHVRVFVKTSKKTLGEKTRGQLNFSIQTTVTANTRYSKSDMQNSIKTATAFYKQNNIDLYFNSPFLMPESTAEICDKTHECLVGLGELFESSRTEQTPLIVGEQRVYFTSENVASDAGIANFSGSVSALFENKMDQFFGVVIWGRQGENMGMVLAHEIGHFLGLYHTDVDNISDTKAYNHWIDKDQKPKGSEISNLMHVSVGKKATLSPAQKNILLRAVAVELYEPIK